jgi:hypothetical protein
MTAAAGVILADTAVRLSEESVAALDVIAVVRGVTRSEAIRMAVDA